MAPQKFATRRRGKQRKEDSRPKRQADGILNAQVNVVPTNPLEALQPLSEIFFQKCRLGVGAEMVWLLAELRAVGY